MCMGCWREYGSPKIVNDLIRAFPPLAAAVYDFNGGGGNLHVVLDDFNIEDRNIAFCRGVIDRVKAGKPQEYDDTDPDQVEAEDRALSSLEKMTLEERASALALWDKFFIPSQQST